MYMYEALYQNKNNITMLYLNVISQWIINIIIVILRLIFSYTIYYLIYIHIFYIHVFYNLYSLINSIIWHDIVNRILGSYSDALLFLKFYMNKS